MDEKSERLYIELGKYDENYKTKMSHNVVENVTRMLKEQLVIHVAES